MEEIKNLLDAREKQLLKIKKEKERALKSAPQGALRVGYCGNYEQYYLRKDPKDFNGHYIRKEDLHIAQKIAQRDYDKKVLQTVEQELRAINNYISVCPEACAEQIYSTLHKGRQKLVNPIIKQDEQYILEWESMPYQAKEFHKDTPEFYTAKNERVRSKSEVIIADLLNREGIPYRYECPLDLDGIGRIYPDFTVLNIKNRKEIYWEHLGMMDNPEYAEKAVRRIAVYERNGIFPGEKLILTYETQRTPLNQKQVMKKIEKYLK